MAIVITIDGVDKTKKVAWESLKIYNIKTSQVDKCSFKIRRYGTDDYEPKAGREVIITDNSVKVFAGFIVRVDQTATDYKVLEYNIECVDYTRLLQKKLVVDNFTNQTVTQIITNIINRYCGDYSIDVSNVNCNVNIESISFNYLPIQQVLEQLADITGYDWWIDYDKNLYFVASSGVPAPFGLTDTNGKYQFNSLRIRKDNSQIKNSIIVRGGSYYASTLTVAVECNGTDFTYPTSYKFKDIKVTLTGQLLDVGIDFSSDADDHDVLYNYNEKVLKWKEEDRPSVGATLSVSGEPLLPVIIKQKNPASISAMLSAENVPGDYEFLITDNKLNSKEEARNRANAELKAYSETLEEGEFITETSGLKAGQTININSDAHGINENYVIREVQAVMMTPSTMKYKISLISTRTLDIIGVLQQLLLNQGDTYLSKDEILDKITSYFETITITDEHTESLSHNPQVETTNLDEIAGANIDKNLVFVAGPYNSFYGSDEVLNGDFSSYTPDPSPADPYTKDVFDNWTNTGDNITHGTDVTYGDYVRLERVANLTYIRQTISTLALGKRYRISFRARTSNVATSLRILFAYNSPGGYLSEYLTLTTEWKNYALEYTTVDVAQKYLYLLSYNNNGTIDITDVQVMVDDEKRVFITNGSRIG